MAQGKLGLRPGSGFAGPSLAQHVALFDQLGEDPVGGALGDPDRGGDVAQPDARVTGDADEDVGVVGQKVPAGAPSSGLCY